MTGSRRLSQAISEGDGISLIVPVDGPEPARRAEAEGAEAVLVLSGDESRLAEIRAASSLPILFYWDGERADAVAGVDACVVDARGDSNWLEQVSAELAGRFELAYRIESEEHLAETLEQFDPEIFVLAAKDDDALEQVLDLLPDVPAGKLAIAEVEVRRRDEVAELERAGVDAVIVDTADLAGLVSESPPDV